MEVKNKHIYSLLKRAQRSSTKYNVHILAKPYCWAPQLNPLEQRQLQGHHHAAGAGASVAASLPGLGFYKSNPVGGNDSRNNIEYIIEMVLIFAAVKWLVRIPGHRYPYLNTDIHVGFWWLKYPWFPMASRIIGKA